MSDLFDAAASEGPLHKRAQRARWFTKAFQDHVAVSELESGNSYTLDQVKLAGVFSTWIDAFNEQKPDNADAQRDYVGFASGLMLRTLIDRQPIKDVSLAKDADDSLPAYFWPEGYVYVTFCLKVRGLVIEMDFHGHQEVSPVLNDTRTWWSFRENVAEDPSLAIAFLDLFAGDAPQWSMPSLFTPRGTSRDTPSLKKTDSPSEQ